MFSYSEIRLVYMFVNKTLCVQKNCIQESGKEQSYHLNIDPLQTFTHACARIFDNTLTYKSPTERDTHTFTDNRGASIVLLEMGLMLFTGASGFRSSKEPPNLYLFTVNSIFN